MGVGEGGTERGLKTVGGEHVWGDGEIRELGLVSDHMILLFSTLRWLSCLQMLEKEPKSSLS